MTVKRRFCTNCGTQVYENSKFCGSCGSSLADDGPSAAAPPAAMAPPAQPIAPPVYQPQTPAYAPPPAPPAYQPPPHYQPPPQYPMNQQGFPPPAYQPPPVYSAQAPAYGYQPQSAGIPGETLTGIIPCASRKKSLVSAEGFNIVVTNHRMIFAEMTNQMVKDEARQKAAGKGFFGGMAANVTAGYDLWKRYLQMPPEQALRENPGNFEIALNQIHRVKFDGGRTIFKKGIVSVGFNVNRDDDEPAKLEIETMGGKHKFDIPSQFQGEARDVLRRSGLIK